MQSQFLLLLLVLILTIVLSADDSKPWYRSKTHHERKLKSEAEKKGVIEYHQQEISDRKKVIEDINREHNLFEEERREIPPGSSKRTELKKKLDESREVRGNIKRQNLLSKILEKDNQHEFSQALKYNAAANTPLKQQKLREEMEAIKAKNNINPTIHDIEYQQDYEKNWDFHTKRRAQEEIIREHEKELKKLQEDSKKKEYGKWKFFPGLGKRE